MITAHLPSGYLLGRGGKVRGWLMIAVLLGAVFPDFGLIWFYGVDGRAFHHHLYWMHIPAFWLTAGAIGLSVCRLTTLETVPATRSHWILSFILHWSFLQKLAIWGTALVPYFKRKPI